MTLLAQNRIQKAHKAETSLPHRMATTRGPPTPPARPCDGLYCSCVHQLCCTKCGTPQLSQEKTIQLFQHDLIEGNNRSGPVDVFGNGPIVLSHVPESAKRIASTLPETSEEINAKESDSKTGKAGGDDRDGVVLGIDEAGRGCVLGPMVYGMAFWHPTQKKYSIPSGFQDSKALSDDTRRALFQQLIRHKDIGFGVRIFWPSEISRNMMRADEPYNLNQMSHDAAMTLIQKVVNAGVAVRKCFIDTVGDPRSYRRKLERQFRNIEFVVESKADANYAPCSAASVVAKVTRDRLIEEWRFSESTLQDDTASGGRSKYLNFGSGYPSDPKCKQWMEELHDPVFGYSNIVRFSWAPAKNAVEKKGVSVEFRADIDEDELQQKKGMAMFMGEKKRKRLPFFQKRKLQVVSKLTSK